MKPINPTSSNCTASVGEPTAKRGPADFCYPFRTETLDSTVPYIVNAVLNIPAVIMAILENILVFVAVRRSTSIRLPSKLLLCSLVLTDLGIGLVAQPGFVVVLFMKASRDASPNCSLIKSTHFAASLFTTVLLLTMTAISLDRYIALFFHLKYHQLVTAKRVSAVLAFSWSFAVFYAVISLCIPELDVVISSVTTLICFVVISVACIRIYRWLRHQYGQQVGDQGEAQAQQQATGSTLNVAKYRRTATALLWIYILVILCYLPYFCVRFINPHSHNRALTECIREFCYTLLLFNSCLNPFVYCFRLPEIRAEVLTQLRKLKC